nr:MAG TPA: hypothetical protein [Caudoviricetes sp.]
MFSMGLVSKTPRTPPQFHQWLRIGNQRKRFARPVRYDR